MYLGGQVGGIVDVLFSAYQIQQMIGFRLLCFLWQ